MAYQTLIDASTIKEFESLASTVGIADLPPGTNILIRVELPSWEPVGKLADLAGTEWFAQQFAPAQVRVVDVYGNWHWIEIKGVVEGTPILLLVAIIIVALSALGIAYFISRIMLSADLPVAAKAAVAGIAGGIAIAAIILGIFFFLGRKK